MVNPNLSFRLWLELDRRLQPNAYALRSKSDVLNYHAKKIEKNIEGWQIFFVDNISIRRPKRDQKLNNDLKQAENRHNFYRNVLESYKNYQTVTPAIRTYLADSVIGYLMDKDETLRMSGVNIQLILKNIQQNDIIGNLSPEQKLALQRLSQTILNEMISSRFFEYGVNLVDYPPIEDFTNVNKIIHDSSELPLDDNQNIHNWLTNSLLELWMEKIKQIIPQLDELVKKSQKGLQRLQNTDKSFFNRAFRGLQNIQNAVWNLESAAKKDETKIARILRAIGQMGIKIRLPIVINYIPATLKAGYFDGEKVVINVAFDGGTSLGVFIHEISHAIYQELSEEDKNRVKQMAYSLPSPTIYGKPGVITQKLVKFTPGPIRNFLQNTFIYPGESHVSGNEWFAEMVATIIAGNKGALDWFRQNFINWKWRYKQSDIDTLKNMMMKPNNEPQLSNEPQP